METMSETFRIGIDLGGTKIECVLLGPDGEEVHRRRIAAPRGVYEHTVAAIRDLVLEADQAAGHKASVGIGIPGAMSRRTGLVKNANSTWLIGKPLAADLEAALGRAVRIENDANCFAVSEAVDGAGQGSPVVFGVILGTGVGAGVVWNDRAVTGRNAIAGEWGHNPLPWPTDDERPGPPCYCGRQGCIETFLSGPGLAADHQRKVGAVLSPEEIVDHATQGDPACRETLDRYADRLARALAHVINIVDPDAIVVGGGLSNIAALYEEVPNRWSRYVFSDEVSTPLLRAKHGDSSGVRGAARLWP